MGNRGPFLRNTVLQQVWQLYEAPSIKIGNSTCIYNCFQPVLSIPMRHFLFLSNMKFKCQVPGRASKESTCRLACISYLVLSPSKIINLNRFLIDNSLCFMFLPFMYTALQWRSETLSVHCQLRFVPLCVLYSWCLDSIRRTRKRIENSNFNLV